MKPQEPQNEHKWLQKLAGEWTYEIDMQPKPGQPAGECKGTEVVRAIGDLWILSEGHGQMPGGVDATMLLTLGFDPRTKRFVGTWVGSMMAHLWVYDGFLDESGKVLTLESEGPSMKGDGALGKYRDVIEIIDDDTRLLRAYWLAEDGKWNSLMVMKHRRVK
jgi:hypothetical protein